MKQIPLALLVVGIISVGILYLAPSTEEASPYKEDIELAKGYAESQDLCTDEYKKLVSPDGKIEYGAPDGCQISFLEDRGWTEPEKEAQEEGVTTTCSSDEECAWVSTNCCPENAGANWECVNEDETVIDCPENPVCPQVISSKPEAECGCAEGTCQEVEK
ncbi:MAG: hypothetical protein ACLFTQ_04170 [Candidatus Aenigmatarchaeota archaeon]